MPPENDTVTSTPASSQGTSTPSTNNNPFNDGLTSQPVSSLPTSESPTPSDARTPVSSQTSDDALPPAVGDPPASAGKGVVSPQQLSPDTIQAIVEATMRGSQAGQKVQPQSSEPQMTQEQFNAHYGMPIVSPEVYEAIIGVGPDKPERAQALQQLLHQATRASVLMAKELAAAEIEKLREEMSPIFAAHQKAAEERIAEEFYTIHKDLKGEEALINEIKDAFIARKTNFASKDEAFNAVANQARQIIARFRGQPQGQQLAGGQPIRNGGRPPVRQMTPSSQGGRSGTGVAAKKSTAEQLFST